MSSSGRVPSVEPGPMMGHDEAPSTERATDQDRGVLVHEWIARVGGSENVLAEMARVFPRAPIFCLWDDSVGRFAQGRVHESWLARTPLRGRKALALPAMPLAWRTLPKVDAEWALISSHLFAHHARFRGSDLRRHVYVHTPARYIWTPEFDGRGDHWSVRAASGPFKTLDRRRAREGADFAANSEFIRRRIADAWGVDARVIHPPVEVTRIQEWDGEDGLTAEEGAMLDGLPSDFVLGASRFIPYKRLDLVIEAGAAVGLPVVLAGGGPELPKLRALAAEASVPVHFVIDPSTTVLWALYRRASAYVFPAIEDFGIMPAEALAAGAPVVTHTIGGAREIVESGISGAVTDFGSASEVAEAVERAISTSADARRDRARRFARERFDREISDWVLG